MRKRQSQKERSHTAHEVNPGVYAEFFCGLVSLHHLQRLVENCLPSLFVVDNLKQPFRDGYTPPIWVSHNSYPPPESKFDENTTS